MPRQQAGKIVGMSIAAMFPETAIAETDLNLPLLWLQLHQDAAMTTGVGSERVANKEDVEAFNIKSLRHLKSVPVHRWSALCAGAGWTTYGAMATSWCQDAKVSHLLEGWLAAQLPPVASETYDRPIRMISRDILPKGAGLGALNDLSGNSLAGLCLLVRSADHRIALDMSEAQLASAAPELIVVLLDNLSSGADRRPPEPSLLSAWAGRCSDDRVLKRIQALRNPGPLV